MTCRSKLTVHFLMIGDVLKFGGVPTKSAPDAPQMRSASARVQTGFSPFRHGTTSC